MKCRLIIHLICLISVLLAATASSFGQLPAPTVCNTPQTAKDGGGSNEMLGRLAVRTFLDKNGLPNNTIRAISFDQRGYLWVGTNDGVAVYNGRKWMPVKFEDRS